jgi:hypothetical protein
MFDVQTYFIFLYSTIIVKFLRVCVFGIYIFIYIGLLFVAFDLWCVCYILVNCSLGLVVYHLETEAVSFWNVVFVFSAGNITREIYTLWDTTGSLGGLLWVR